MMKFWIEIFVKLVGLFGWHTLVNGLKWKITTMVLQFFNPDVVAIDNHFDFGIWFFFFWEVAYFLYPAFGLYLSLTTRVELFVGF